MGYHIREIPKGEIGKISKITEEFAELIDAKEQGSKILELVELSDLLGAIELYLEKEYRGCITIQDLIQMSSLTRRAFEDGSRG